MAVDASLSLADGRDVYLAENGLPADGGYDDNWVVIKLGPIPVLAFPNTEGRKRDVPFHDLHHVLTGYSTTVLGEAEIGAWELGSDCTKSPAAVFLNCLVFGSMLPFYPRHLFGEFLRGRRAQNLYGSSHYGEMLSRSIGEMRAELGMDAPVGEASADDRRAFRRWATRAIVGSWGPLIPIVALCWWVWS